MGIRSLLFVLLITLFPFFAWAGEPLNVAVVANFTGSFEPIAKVFEEKSGTHINVISGSTGKLYNQIVLGSPVDVFLSADQKHVDLLIADDRANAGDRMTYAIGRLVLLAPAAKDVTNIEQTLKEAEKISLANPELAPYGMAAKQTLEHLGLLDTLSPKFVYGESIAQAYQFVDSKAADAGFIALSQALAGKQKSFIEIPSQYYDPLVQDAVILTGTKKMDVAKEFLKFLSSPDIVSVIRGSGYAVPED